MEQKKAILFDIGRFRSTDGPGIRTILFFKGCPLRCKWCSNPFGLSPRPQLVVNPAKCTGCGTCVETCPHGVNRIDQESHRVRTEFTACRLCGACTKVCPAGTRMISGQEYTPQALYREAAKDQAFYRRGGGGVTLSGGEALMQYEAAAETLRLCRNAAINTCLETSAFAPWDHLWAVAQYCSTVFVDVKHMDGERHKALTGVGNQLILENIRRLCQELPRRGGRVILRLPLVPGYTDSPENVAATARFAAGLEGTPELNLLPYHNLGESKYEMIGASYGLGDVESRKGRDPRLLELQALARETAPENRVSLGGDDIQLG